MFQTANEAPSFSFYIDEYKDISIMLKKSGVSYVASRNLEEEFRDAVRHMDRLKNCDETFYALNMVVQRFFDELIKEGRLVCSDEEKCFGVTKIHTRDIEITTILKNGKPDYSVFIGVDRFDLSDELREHIAELINLRGDEFFNDHTQAKIKQVIVMVDHKQRLLIDRENKMLDLEAE